MNEFRPRPKNGKAAAERRLVAAFAATVASFVVATVVTHWSAAGIQTAAVSISSNAAPSLVRLAEAREALRHLQVRLTLMTEQPAQQPLAYGEDGVAHLRYDLHQAIARYEALPTYKGERETWPELDGSLADIDDASREVLGLVAAGETPAARRAAAGHLNRAADRLDHAIERVREINVETSTTLAATIERLRMRSLVVGLGLDALSVLLTLAAAGLALRELRSSTAALEHRAAELEQFAGRVAHDLATPISSVGLALDCAQRMTTEADVAQMVSRGRASLKRARRIMDDLLAFARAGASANLDQRTEVGQAITGVLEDLRGRAAEKEVELGAEPCAALEVACGSGVLTSLLANLVDNAIKYMGDSDPRRVTVRVLRRGARVRIEVEDTGPGLAPELQDAVFEPFVRGPTGGEPGTGLGLATVRRVVRAHGGEVGVRSPPGGPCVFWFELPRASVTTPPA